MASQSPPEAGATGQPTEDEMRAYLAQLREADPAEIIAQAYTMLGTGAEVKLGRPDARTLIDALAALVEAAQARLPSDLVARMRDGVGQLQVAQVQAERQTGAAGTAREEAPASSKAEQTSAGGEQRGEPAGGTASGGQSPPGAERPMTDRLWIPGRDPRPR